MPDFCSILFTALSSSSKRSFEVLTGAHVVNNKTRSVSTVDYSELCLRSSVDWHMIEESQMTMGYVYVKLARTLLLSLEVNCVDDKASYGRGFI